MGERIEQAIRPGWVVTMGAEQAGVHPRFLMDTLAPENCAEADSFKQAGISVDVATPPDDLIDQYIDTPIDQVSNAWVREYFEALTRARGARDGKIIKAITAPTAEEIAQLRVKSGSGPYGDFARRQDVCDYLARPDVDGRPYAAAVTRFVRDMGNEGRVVAVVLAEDRASDERHVVFSMTDVNYRGQLLVTALLYNLRHYYKYSGLMTLDRWRLGALSPDLGVMAGMSQDYRDNRAMVREILDNPNRPFVEDERQVLLRLQSLVGAHDLLVDLLGFTRVRRNDYCPGASGFNYAYDGYKYKSDSESLRKWRKANGYCDGDEHELGVVSVNDWRDDQGYEAIEAVRRYLEGLETEGFDPNRRRRQAKEMLERREVMQREGRVCRDEDLPVDYIGPMAQLRRYGGPGFE